MKLFNFLPVALAYPDRTQVYNKLSASGQRNETSLGVLANAPPMVLNENSRASCEQQVIEDRILKCERYGYSKNDCAIYINNEMVRTCRGSYTCAVASWLHELATYWRYGAHGFRKKFEK